MAKAKQPKQTKAETGGNPTTAAQRKKKQQDAQKQLEEAFLASERKRKTPGKNLQLTADEISRTNDFLDIIRILSDDMKDADELLYGRIVKDLVKVAALLEVLTDADEYILRPGGKTLPRAARAGEDDEDEAEEEEKPAKKPAKKKPTKSTKPIQEDVSDNNEDDDQSVQPTTPVKLRVPKTPKAGVSKSASKTKGKGAKIKLIGPKKVGGSKSPQKGSKASNSSRKRKSPDDVGEEVAAAGSSRKSPRLSGSKQEFRSL